ncbi:MAG: hypothetical protein J2P31_21420, partial [Blastocatellia bacterium]|nr:hypothetical protein [Blastocatellia bacterium]
IMEVSDWKEGLVSGLTRFVKEHSAMMEKKEPLVRALIGDAKLLPESTRDMLIETIKPYRQRLERSISEAQQRGEARADLNEQCVADILRDVLLAGMLRRTGYREKRYTVEEYLSTVIDLFTHGMKTKKE